MSPPRVLPWTAPALPGQVQLGTLVMGYRTFYAIDTIEGLDLPPIAAAEAERANADGSFGGIDVMPKRPLILHMTLHPDMVAGSPAKALLARDLKAAFQPATDLVGLTINDPDLGQLLLLGRPRRVSFAVDRSIGFRSQEGVLAQFDALDPLLYSATLQDLLIPFGTAGTNAGLPFVTTAALPGMNFQPSRMVQNGGFESAAATDGGWLTTASVLLNAGAVLTRDTGTKRSGAASGKVVTSGASQFQGIRQRTLVNLLPNTSYTFTCWVNLTTAGGQPRLVVYDVTNAIQAASAAPVTTTGTFQLQTATIVTGPTGPVQIEVSVRDDAVAGVRTFYVDDSRGDLAASAQAYADPSTALGAVFDAIGGGGGAAGFATAVNNGTRSSQPVSLIRAVGGPVTGPLHLERVESGEVITLNFSLNAGDTLELDHDLHTVTYNGQTNRADVVDISTAWWTMRPGNNTIHYRTDGPGAGSTADIKWRDAWL